MNTKDLRVTSAGLGLKERELHVCEAELRPVEERQILSNDKYRSKKKRLSENCTH